MKPKGSSQQFPFEMAENCLQMPPLYKVVVLNDDFTPMEFVIQVLEKFFSLPSEDAKQLMLRIHKDGKGVCGVYTYEIAETKITEVKNFARDHDYPLMCQLEEA